MSETAVLSGDGIRSVELHAVAVEVADLINQGFAAAWGKERDLEQGGQNAVAVAETSVDSTYGASVTLPGTVRLGDNAIARVICRFEDRRGSAKLPEAGVSVVRHQARFNVFSDTVELQLFSVLTLTNGDGKPVWQGGVRSTKQFNAWSDGDGLAALAASFVAVSVRENASNLAKLYGKGAFKAKQSVSLRGESAPPEITYLE